MPSPLPSIHLPPTLVQARRSDRGGRSTSPHYEHRREGSPRRGDSDESSRRSSPDLEAEGRESKRARLGDEQPPRRTPALRGAPTAGSRPSAAPAGSKATDKPRAKYSTRPGLCVYRIDRSCDVPLVIVSHELVELSTRGQAEKVLNLQPLRPPGAESVQLPAKQAVPLDDLFKTKWETYKCDQATDANREVYDAHIEAARKQAAAVERTPRAVFVELRYGRGKPALDALPRELEPDPAI